MRRLHARWDALRALLELPTCGWGKSSVLKDASLLALENRRESTSSIAHCPQNRARCEAPRSHKSTDHAAPPAVPGNKSALTAPLHWCCQTAANARAGGGDHHIAAARHAAAAGHAQPCSAA